MLRQGALAKLKSAVDDTIIDRDGLIPKALGSEAECLEQILEAFRDIADGDNIHQAAERLVLVQDWMRRRATIQPGQTGESQARLREQGLRPIQIWVPDVESDEFKAEAHRQSLLVAQSPQAEEDQNFVDAIIDWDET